MDRIYVVSLDGRVFTANKSSESFDLLRYDESNKHFIKVKKVSSSEWCLWALSAQFQVFVYVFRLDTRYEHQEITYENQRRYNLLSSNSFTSKLLLTDRYAFSSLDGTQDLPKDNFKLPSDSWEWKSDWLYEQTATDGWEYAIDFPTQFYQQSFFGACVRRRKWARVRVFTKYDQFLKIDFPSQDECVIDLSVGGWEIPYCEKGYQSVWAITNSGKLYYRSDVSQSNPEGSKWLSVPIPSDLYAFTCSCSPSGKLCVLAYEGDIMIRTGISRSSPSGTGWQTLARPDSLSSLRQVVFNDSRVWVLENQGNVFYRAGITSSCPLGFKWVRIPANMLSISLSPKNLLWGVSAADNSFWYRISDEDSSSGIGWQQIKLKFKKAQRFFQLPVDEENQSMIGQEVNDSLAETSVESEAKPDVKPVIQQEQELFEGCIYDEDGDSSIYDDDSLYGKDRSQLIEGNKPQRIDISSYMPANYDEIAQGVEDANSRLDLILEEMRRDKSEARKSESEAKAAATAAANNQAPAQEDYFDNLVGEEEAAKSDDSSSTKFSMNGSFSEPNEYFELDLCSCSATSFQLAPPPNNWFDENKETQDNISNKVPAQIEWRNHLLRQLIDRNLRENTHIDKISVAYENDSSWSRVEKFEFYYKGKVVPCVLEITHSRRFNNVYQKFEKTYVANLSIKVIHRSKIAWQMSLDFKMILLATRYIMLKREHIPCFALMVEGHQKPFIFFASSDSVVKDWLNQISIYRNKYSGCHDLKSAITLVSMKGFAYICIKTDDKLPYFTQIDGHFKYVEKHSSGVMYGCGENGELWVQSDQNNQLRESYIGPYIQTDEVELTTFENQRWNAVTGVMGLRNGFTSIGLPTDRPTWSDESGRVRRRKEDCKLPSYLFNWSSEWRVDYSLMPGVDIDGWQYAFDFPASYHPVRNPLKDFVRRRRWSRRCRIKSSGMWQPVNQIHKLTSISLDQELPTAHKYIVVWATDINGYVLVSLVDKQSPSQIKWTQVDSDERFKFVSMGCNMQVWAVDTNGHVFYRVGVDLKNGNYRGTSWSRVRFDENETQEEKLKMLSVGNYCVWAISDANDLYIRKNITKSYPEGTSWTRVDTYMKFVSVNRENQVLAVSSELSKNPNIMWNRQGVTEKKLAGINWQPVFPMEIKTASNRGQ